MQKPNINANFKDEVALVDEEVMDPETHSFMQTLIQQIFFEILLCVRQCSSCLENISEQNR